MNAGKRDIAYDVTISEELRALRRSHSASGVAITTAREEALCEPPQGTRDVFTGWRLRVDGSMPLRVVASEILRLDVGEAEQSLREARSDPEPGYACLRLLLTEEGVCLAHLSAQPCSTGSERPVHRVGEMQTSSDIMALVQLCHDDFLYTARSDLLAASSSGNPKPAPEPHFEQLKRDLVPFVETPLN